MIVPVIQSCLLLLLPLVVPSSAAGCDSQTGKIECKDSKKPSALLEIKDGEYERLEYATCRRGKLEGKIKGAVTIAIKSKDICYEGCKVAMKKISQECRPSGDCKPATLVNSEFTCESGFHLQFLRNGDKAWTGVYKHICIGEKLYIDVIADKGKHKFTENKEASLQCRKNIDRGDACEAKPYFDPKECDVASTCTQPTIEANKKVTCTTGSLEYYIDKWEAGSEFSLECNSKRLIDMKKGGFRYEPQLIRCRQEKECGMDIASLSTGVDCPKGDTCKPITLANKKELKCSSGENIEGSELPTGKPWFKLDKARCLGNSFQFQSQGREEYDGTKINKFRCHKPKLCTEMDKFYDAALCDKDYVCKTPDSTHKCEIGYTTEFSQSNPEIFSAVESIVCDNNQLMVQMNGKRSDMIPIGFRCSTKRGCDPSNNYEPLTCDTDHQCEMPQLDQKTLKCSSGYELQMKEGNAWSGVQSITCKDEILKSKDANGKEALLISARCTRRKCAACLDPCPTCAPPFNYNTEWDQCASFECGVNSRIVIGGEQLGEKMECDTEGVSWKTANGTKININGEVKCDKLCTLHTQLSSSCEGDNLCETITFNDYQPIKCETKMARRSFKNQKVTKGSSLFCNRDKGEWMFTTFSTGDVKVEEKDNIYCTFDCDVYSFCRDCVVDEHAVYRCPEEKDAVVVDSGTASRKRSNASSSFTCKKGRWIDDMGTELDGTDEISCEYPADSSPTGASVQTILVAYVIGLFFFIVVIALSLTYIVCRMQGKGWLHNIVLAKIRGDKKNEKRVVVRKQERKTSGKSTMSGKSAEKTEKNVDQSSAENVRPSGEKVSAEPAVGAERIQNASENPSEDHTNAPTGETTNETVDRNAPQMYYA